MGKFRLITGDAGQILDRLIEEGTKVDMVFTSPNPPFYSKDEKDPREKEMPGNIGNEPNFTLYIDNLMQVFEKVRAILKDTGSLWVHAGDYSTFKGGSRIQVPQRIALTLTDKYKWFLKSTLIWFRPEPYEKILTRFKQDYEYIYWFSKTEDVKIYDNQYLETSIIEARYIPPPQGVWDSGFPEGLIYIPIKTCTTHGQTVLDPYSGTGSTGAVALKMKRKYIGIDLFPHKTNRTMERLRVIEKP